MLNVDANLSEYYPAKHRLELTDLMAKSGTLQEISALAGVSPATVSRVMNGRPGVSPPIVEKVRSAMREMNVSPASRGRDAAKLKHRTVGLCIVRRDALMRYSSEFIGSVFGVQAALAEQSINMVLGEISDTAVAPFLESGEIDGLILAGQQLDADSLARLPNLPRVWLTSHYEPGCPSALQGNEVIGQMAATYLLDRGCRKLAFLDMFHGNPAHAVRAEYFTLAAQRRGVETLRIRGDAFLAEDRVVGGWARVAEVVEAQIELLVSSNPRPDGLFVPIEPVVGLVYRELLARNVQPGRDIEVIVCGNNVPLVAALRPTPAVIDLGGEAIGRAAVEQLMLRILHPDSAGRLEVAVRPKVVPGDSVGKSR